MTMKKTVILLLMVLGMKGFAQLPYFQQDHTLATTGVTYSDPQDIHYDGTGQVYSYHQTNKGGVITTYNSTTGSMINVNGHEWLGGIIAPVRIKTVGGFYYALSNVVVSGQTRFMITAF